MKKIYYFIIAIIAPALIIIACHKETFSDNVLQIRETAVGSDPVKLAGFKSFFDTIPQSRLSAVNGSEPIIYDPVWEKAIQFKRSDNLTEVPVTVKGKYPKIIMSKNLNPSQYEKDHPEALAGSIHLLFVTKTTGEKKVIVLRYVPDIESGYTLTSDVHFCNFTQKKFSGYIHGVTLQGEDLGGFRVEKGKIIGKTNLANVNRQTLDTRSYQVCTTTYTDWYQLGPDGYTYLDTQVGTTTCTTYDDGGGGYSNYISGGNTFGGYYYSGGGGLNTGYPGPSNNINEAIGGPYLKCSSIVFSYSIFNYDKMLYKQAPVQATIDKIEIYVPDKSNPQNSPTLVTFNMQIFIPSLKVNQGAPSVQKAYISAYNATLGRFTATDNPDDIKNYFINHMNNTTLPKDLGQVDVHLTSPDLVNGYEAHYYTESEYQANGCKQY